MLRKPKRSHKKRNIIIAVALLAIVVGGVVVAGRTEHWWDGSNTSSKQNDPTQPKTRTETTEGKKIEVPIDTPKDAVKDYVLITEDERFKIRQSPGTDNYIITLYAIINRPDQYDMYQDQLREYKQAALDYLKGKGVNTDKVNITYEPQEATNL